MTPRLSVIIVAYNSLDDLRETLPPLMGELRAADEVVVVDNGSADGLVEALPRLFPAMRLIVAPGNLGFAAGVNLGADAARGDLLVLLNPDATVQAGWGEAIRELWGSQWAAWMGLVTMDGGAAINTSGGVLHFTGLGWAGQAGAPSSAAPAGVTEVGFLSGACLALPRKTWARAGGFPPEFFMYCEDVDLSLRLRLAGGRIAVNPHAVAVHDYDFHKGASKWRLLERNRWATIVRTYPSALLALVAPALAAAELAIWLVAIRGGWAGMKARASVDVLRSFPRLRRERRAIQATRAIGAAAFAAGLTAELSSEYLGDVARNPWVGRLLGLYWGAVRALLALPGLSGEPATGTTRP